jgi:N-acetylneuraminic acid mutarotase
MKSVTFTFVSMALLFLSACGGGLPASTPTAGANEWTWVDGAEVIGTSGTYGTAGMPAVSNVPGAREQAVGWTDASGNFWLFGGNGFDSVGNNGFLNDLWLFSSGQWAWVGGSNMVDEQGTYGTQGIPAATNVPGSRNGEVGWIDASGNLWLFGGYGIDSGSNIGFLNDLWKYSSSQWTWIGGSNVVDEQGSYGTQGTPAATNVPGARSGEVGWIDASGNLWLFGGNTYDSTGTQNYVNDLWKYSGGQWTWIGGSNMPNQQGTYGTEGTGASGNVPGAREQAFVWTDASGNFWLFGGNGFDSVGNSGLLNDLWEYKGGQWIWVSGSKLVNQPGSYGLQGTRSSSNAPGARDSGVSWTDASGNFWLFGGEGYDSAGTNGGLNDLWEYSSGQWTWVSGSIASDQAGTYGTEGAASSSTSPGARIHAVGWTDSLGNLWLFSGNGDDSTGASGYLNDSWKFQP